MRTTTIEVAVDETADAPTAQLTLTVDGTQVTAEDVGPAGWRDLAATLRSHLGDDADQALTAVEAAVTAALAAREQAQSDLLDRVRAANEAWTGALT